MPDNRKTVLFSPVSDSDPAREDPKNKEIFRDGAMLHIVRNYKPEKVCLYMTERFAAFERADHRFTELIHHVAPECDVEIEYCADNGRIAQFDYFDQPFRKILERLHGENEDATLLLNLSSGTPQMQAALYLAAATSPFPVVPVQVSTPKQDSNFSRSSSYDVNKVQTHLGEDGKFGGEYTAVRYRKVTCQNARRSVQEENINALVNSYDYSAAKLICKSKSAKALFSPKVELLLRAATDHLTLNKEDTEKLREQLLKSPDNAELLYFLWEDFYEQPAKIAAGTERWCYDYLLYMGTLIDRAAYSDFARALSPVLTTVMQMRLHSAGYDIMQFCMTDNNGVVKLNSFKVGTKDRNFLNFLNQKYAPRSFQDGALSAQHMLLYMEYLKKQGTDLEYNNFECLREAEKKIRNLAAHEMCGISAREIEQEAHISAKELLRLLQEEYQKALGITGLQWNGLKRLNQRIFDETKKMPQ